MPGPDDKPNDATPVVDAAAAPIVADPSQTAIPDAPVTAQPDLVPAAQPAAEVAPEASAAVAPTPEPSLLDKFDAKQAEEKAKADPKPDDAAKVEEPPKPVDEKKAEEKPAEEAKPDEVKADEPAAIDAPVLDPVDYFHAETGIKLPETIQMDDATRGEFTGALDLLRADPLKGAQALVDLHNKQMTAYAEHLGAEQWRVFREMGQANVVAVMADPILGGAGHDTAMAQVAIARDNLASRAKLDSPQYLRETAEFNDMLKNTGAGNTPAMLRFMHNAARYVGEAKLPPPNPKPADGHKNPNAPRKGIVYDNPTSQT